MSGYVLSADADFDLDEMREYIAADNTDAAGSPTSFLPDDNILYRLVKQARRHRTQGCEATPLDRPLTKRLEQCQFCTGMYSVCVPAKPPRLKVNGTASPAATFGTTKLNWYRPISPGARPQ